MQEKSLNISVKRLDPVRDQVADRLREAIVDMQLQPGQVLVERELCEATTASRASVREALRRLESEGLVVSEPGKGTRVATLRPDEAVHLYQVRMALEALAARLFALHASDKELADLERAVEEIEAVADDPTSMLRAKTEFYEVLFAGSGNPELRRMLHALHRRVTALRATSLAVPGRPAQSVAEMREILRAAQARDADRAARLCAGHVRAAAHAALGGQGHDLTALDLDQG